jgi:flagellar motor switch protein FliN
MTADQGPSPDIFSCLQEAVVFVLSQITSQKWSAEPDASNEDDERVSICLRLEKGLRGVVRLGLPTPAALRLVAVFAGVTAVSWGNDEREAIEELFRQCAGQLVAKLKASFGEIEFRIIEEPGFAPADAALAFRLSGPDGEPIPIRVDLDHELHEALQQSEPASVPGSSITHQIPDNLDLLKHVELKVTLRFGQRQMRLQDILDLQSGSVIELDREIHEPVDLLLDGRVIARGQVVVVDGNYGLRISEVGPSSS